MKKLILTAFIFLTIILTPIIAQTAGTEDKACKDANNCTAITNPLGDKTNSIPLLLGKVINASLGIVGSLALVMFIYGGFIWMLAAGNDQKVQKGKDIILWAVIGLIVIFSSYALVNLVLDAMSK